MKKRKAISLLVLSVIVLALWGFLTFASFQIPEYTIGGRTYVNNYDSVMSSIDLGIDLEGGVYVVLRVDPEATKDMSSREIEDGINGSISILRTRLDGKGYTEATIQRVGDDQIRIEIPAVDNAEEVFDIIGKTAQLEFRDANGEVILTGDLVKKAYVTMDDNSQYAVGLEFNKEGTQKFADATTSAASSNAKIGIYVDDELLTEPTVNEAITTGSAIITGQYTYDTAYDLAMQINSGALKLPLITVEPRVISSTLGEEALSSGLLAGAIGLILILVYMAVVYRGLGLVADLALIFYVFVVLLFLAILPFIQLTLAGIAGVILGIGMAVDANVIIFERIKDEYSLGKEFEVAVKEGFKKSTVAILDANVTTLIAAIVLWILGNGTVQGFAMSLVVSIVLSFISAVLVSKFFLKIFAAFGKNEKFFGLAKRNVEKEA